MYSDLFITVGRICSTRPEEKVRQKSAQNVLIFIAESHIIIDSQ